MEYIFFGNHSSLPGRLERALNRRVVECPTLTQFCQAMVHVDPVNFCIFLEKDDVREDLETIQNYESSILPPILFYLRISWIKKKRSHI